MASGNSRGPVEGIDALHFVGIGDQPAGEIVGADEGVAALDVIGEIGQGPFVEELAGLADAFRRFRLPGP